jgi:hypothetical protein
MSITFHRGPYGVGVKYALLYRNPDGSKVSELDIKLWRWCISIGFGFPTVNEEL